MKILPPSESAEIGGRNPNCEKNPKNVKILPRSESAEIGGEYPNCEKVPTVKTSPRSGSAETSPDLGPLLPGSWDRPAAADKEECTVFAFNNKVRTFSLSVDKKASTGLLLYGIVWLSQRCQPCCLPGQTNRLNTPQLRMYLTALSLAFLLLKKYGVIAASSTFPLLRSNEFGTHCAVAKLTSIACSCVPSIINGSPANTVAMIPVRSCLRRCCSSMW